MFNNYSKLKSLEQFSTYVENKNVILVGPAGYLKGQNRGAEFDSYDLVVRIKWGVTKAEHFDYGTRTDIVYISLKRKVFLDGLSVSKLHNDKVKWLVISRYNKAVLNMAIPRIPKNIRVAVPLVETPFVKKVANASGSHPNTGVEAILHLLDSPIKTLTVVGVDFHASGYAKGYDKFSVSHMIDPMKNSAKIVALSQDCRKVRNVNEWPKPEGKINIKKLAAYIGKIDDPRLIVDPIIKERLEVAVKDALRHERLLCLHKR